MLGQTAVLPVRLPRPMSRLLSKARVHQDVRGGRQREHQVLLSAPLLSAGSGSLSPAVAGMSASGAAAYVSASRLIMSAATQKGSGVFDVSSGLNPGPCSQTRREIARFPPVGALWQA